MPQPVAHARTALNASAIKTPMNPPKKANWLVRLGAHEWVRHTYARPADDPIRLLGSVRRGPQIGALGITADKKYVQVVGDYVVPLNQGQIKQAIAKYKAYEARLAAATTPHAHSTAPTRHATQPLRVPPTPQPTTNTHEINHKHPQTHKKQVGAGLLRLSWRRRHALQQQR